MDSIDALVIGDDRFDFHRLSEKAPLFESIFADTPIEATITTDRSALERDALADRDVVVDYLSEPPTERLDDLIAFVRDGGGLVGIHGATMVSTFVDEPADDVAALFGGRFVQHPAQQSFGVRVVDEEHPITAGVPSTFEVTDEPYEIEVEPDADNRVLADMDHPDLAGTPVCWTRSEGAGRVVYCSLGHTDETFEHDAFRRLVVRGVAWATRSPVAEEDTQASREP